MAAHACPAAICGRHTHRLSAAVVDAAEALRHNRPTLCPALRRDGVEQGHHEPRPPPCRRALPREDRPCSGGGQSRGAHEPRRRTARLDLAVAHGHRPAAGLGRARQQTGERGRSALSQPRAADARLVQAGAAELPARPPEPHVRGERPFRGDPPHGFASF